MMKISSLLMTVILVLGLFGLSYSQEKKVRVSPKAFVKQTIGFTDVEISYSRPGVKNRKIYDGLVPYGKVWRAGADEATKITFSTDVVIEGKKLAKGSYSFFVIPNKDSWTIIFNKVANQWGAFEYNEAEDALRVTVKPHKTDNEEWLKYEFEGMKTNSSIITLHWEKIKISFKVEVNI